MKIHFFLLFTLLFVACNGTKHYSKTIIEPVLAKTTLDPVQQEIDEIFSLLAYAIVYEDWQPHEVPRRERRGYNIGAVLVDQNNQPVFHGLNSINSTDNATQHGEVRSIMGYLEKTRQFNLKGHTIYTTLEPCVMCAGMITMTAFERAVYGQNDVEYSKAFERLAVDTRPIGGFPPYPRKVEAMENTTPFCKELDDAYAHFLATDPEKFLAKFLTSDEAKNLYERAYNAFKDYKVKNKINQNVYDEAVKFFNDINK